MSTVVAGGSDSPRAGSGRDGTSAAGGSDRAGPARAGRFAGVPHVVVATIAGAWALAIATEVTGTAGRVHHDALIEGGPPLAIALVLFLVAWQMMIAAMMLPSSLPLVRLFAAASAGQPRPRAAMGGLLAGYAAVWTAFGAAAFLFDVGVHAAVDASAWLRAHDGLIGPATLALAGAFQFTPLKDACLRKCRHPAQFLIRDYRRGARGGLRLGALHGVFCVGCCWALMLVMFAAGVASLVWMGLLTGVMVLEKTRPAGRRSVPVTGAALLGAATILGAYAVYAAG
jgi:predicted metal-binding membrane protein